jgi:hypothetical protein
LNLSPAFTIFRIALVSGLPWFQDCLAVTKASAQAALAEASPILQASAGGPAARSNVGIGGVVNKL